MSNWITVEGRLTRDSELKYLPTGTALAEVSIASSDWNGKEEYTSFFDCQLYGKKAESLQQYLTKGKQVVVNGKMRQDRWENKEGQKRNAWKLGIVDLRLVGGNSEKQGTPESFTEKSGDIPF